MSLKRRGTPDISSSLINKLLNEQPGVQQPQYQQQPQQPQQIQYQQPPQQQYTAPVRPHQQSEVQQPIQSGNGLETMTDGQLNDLAKKACEIMLKREMQPHLDNILFDLAYLKNNQDCVMTIIYNNGTVFRKIYFPEPTEADNSEKVYVDQDKKEFIMHGLIQAEQVTVYDPSIEPVEPQPTQNSENNGSS